MNPELKFYRVVWAAAEANAGGEEDRFQRILQREDERDEEEKGGPIGKRSLKVSKQSKSSDWKMCQADKWQWSYNLQATNNWSVSYKDKDKDKDKDKEKDKDKVQKRLNMCYWQLAGKI